MAGVVIALVFFLWFLVKIKRYSAKDEIPDRPDANQMNSEVADVRYSLDIEDEIIMSSINREILFSGELNDKTLKNLG